MDNNPQGITFIREKTLRSTKLNSDKNDETIEFDSDCHLMLDQAQDMISKH